MKNLKTFEEYQETLEKNNVEIFQKQFNAVKKWNQGYNDNNVPDNIDKDTDPNYRFTISKKIPIGSKNPTKQFQKWNSNFWSPDKPKKMGKVKHKKKK